MALLRWIRSRREGKIVALHVDALLSQATGLIREATLPRAAALPKAEARGYIRAKATTILLTALETWSARTNEAVPARLKQIVLISAAERATVTLVEQLAAARTQTGRQRRAA